MTLINNLTTTLLGGSYTGEVAVQLLNDKLIINTGQDNVTFFAPEAKYKVSGHEETTAPSGEYRFLFEEGFLVDVVGKGPTSTPPPTASDEAVDVFDRSLFQYTNKYPSGFGKL